MPTTAIGSCSRSSRSATRAVAASNSAPIRRKCCTSRTSVAVVSGIAEPPVEQFLGTCGVGQAGSVQVLDRADGPQGVQPTGQPDAFGVAGARQQGAQI